MGNNIKYIIPFWYEKTYWKLKTSQKFSFRFVAFLHHITELLRSEFLFFVFYLLLAFSLSRFVWNYIEFLLNLKQNFFHFVFTISFGIKFYDGREVFCRNVRIDYIWSIFMFIGWNFYTYDCWKKLVLKLTALEHLLLERFLKMCLFEVFEFVLAENP